MPEITCPNCQGVNQGSNLFCIFCGRGLPPQPGAPDLPEGGTGGEDAPQDFPTEISLLRSQLREAGIFLDQLQDRVFQLELRSATPAAPRPAAQAPEPEVPEAAGSPPVLEPEPAPGEDAEDVGPGVEVPAGAVLEALPGPVAAAGAMAIGTPATPERRLGFFEALGLPNLSIDWENLLGRNWFAIIGAVTLVLGIGFFLKLAFDNNWIGDTGRVLLGAGLGLALFGTGEYAHRRVPIWAQPVTAGGASILYLSIYASFRALPTHPARRSVPSVGRGRGGCRGLGPAVRVHRHSGFGDIGRLSLPNSLGSGPPRCPVGAGLYPGD